MPNQYQKQIMFKRKQDVDKHVLSVLNRKKDEKERNAQGYQIARLYLDIKEYETAKRYLAGFLHLRDNSPQAHQMMGEINEALGKKDLAIENYKRALDLGGFGSSNRQLVLKICELYCDLGTDDQRMKYWLQKCEELFPRSEIVYKMKSQLLSSSTNGSSGSNNAEMENLLLEELLNRPKDLDLRVKLLKLYLDMGRIEEAYDAAVDTDLTTAFVDSLPWYECVWNVFENYGQSNPDAASDTDFLLMEMHVLRNVTFLSLPKKDLNTSVQLMKKFDQAVKKGESLDMQEESWLALVKEMKGQVLYLAGLFLIKRAIVGSIPWQEVNNLSGACFLACLSVSPLDAQSAWFVKPRQEHAKFYNWWYQQSNDRLSQAGHMVQQLSQNEATDWSRTVHQQVMTGSGHKRVFEAVYGGGGGGSREDADQSFLYGTDLMVANRLQEPLTSRQLLDIDRVAYQVHLGKLSHVVWLCLQRYSPNMECQPNYHFSLMENIQFNVKNMETAGSENLCQLDILTFLLASVRCAAASISDNVFLYDDQSGRPSLLPVSLSRPFCTQDQEEWWDAAFKFCSNSVKESFSRLRRVLIRGVEVVRLKGSHGVSIPMQCHLARCLDAKVKSLKDSEFGCRCSAAELAALEARALFYWERAYESLQKFKKNQHPPIVKNRLFKEAGDGDLPPRLVDKLVSEAEFATALAYMVKQRYEDALERFGRHKSPWASFYSAQIHRRQAEKCQDEEKVDTFKCLMRKSRDLLYKAVDLLNGDKSHELNFLVSKELDDLEIEIQGFDWDENESFSARDSFYTPTKTPSSYNTASSTTHHRGGDSTNMSSFQFAHSTPRHPTSANNTNGHAVSPPQDSVDASASRSNQSHLNGSASTSPQSQPSRQQLLRPSPERMDSQIKSLGYSQTTLFKMVLDRNEELMLMHSKIMDENGSHNSQLKEALSENKKLMEDLKVMLVENRDMLKGIKTELATLKSGVMAAPSPIPAPVPPQLIVAQPPPPSHLPQAHRGGVAAAAAYPGFQPPPPPPQAGLPAYPGYLLNSPLPPGVTPPTAAAANPQAVGPGAAANYRFPAAAAGPRSSLVGKLKLGEVGGVGGEEDEEEEDLEHTVEDLTAMYPEYFGGQDDYSQYYTPDSHLQDWSLRSPGMDPTMGPLSMSPAIQQPHQPQLSASRMPMPQPGFFASALRGHSLQYQQQQQQQQQPTIPGPVVAPMNQGAVVGVGVGGNLIGTNLFSSSSSQQSPAASVVVPPTFSLSNNATAAENMNAAALSPSVQGNIPIFSAMSSLGGGSNTASPAVTSQVSGLKEALAMGQQGGRSSLPSGFTVLFHIKAILPAKNVRGGITILLGPNNSRTTVVMMSDNEDMLFQHDVNGLVLQPPAPGNPGITWIAYKIGCSNSPTPEKETVTIVTLPESMGNLLREALQKVSTAAAATSAPSSVATPLFGGKATASSGAPSLFGNTATAATTTTPTIAANPPPPPPPPSSSSSSGAAAKTVFGGFSFSSTPVFNPAAAHAEREKAAPHKGVTSPVKTDVKPFAGVSLSIPKFSPAATAPTGGATASQQQISPQKNEDSRTEEYEPNVDFKPVIPLPELVEKTTGEENETVVFVDRCRLFRYDTQTNQWKERGVGEMKILCDNQEHRYRVVMRRDQIFKLCANHFISASMKLSPLASSDKTWCYSANDYSDEEMKMEQLAVKFKNPEKASRFKDAFEDCVAKTQAGNVGERDGSFQASAAASPSYKTTPAASSKPQTTSSPSSISSTTPATTTTTTSATSKGDLSELFKPKPGSWECPNCLCQNQAHHSKCPACNKPQPGLESSTSQSSLSSSTTTPFKSGIAPGGGFVFGSAGSSSLSPSSVFGGAGTGVGSGFGSAATASKTPAASSSASTSTPAASKTPAPAQQPVSSKPAATAGGAVPLSELFKPKAGSWECEGCYCQNEAKHLECPACGKRQPGVSAEDLAKSKTTSSTAGGFNFGSIAPSGGFSFGAPPAPAATEKSATSTTAFGASGGGISFGLPAATTAASSTTSGGFTFPGSGGFSFGTPTTTTAAAATTTVAPKPPSASTIAAMMTKKTETPPSSKAQQPENKTTAATTPKGKGKESASLLASLLTADETDAKPAEDKADGFSFTMKPAQQKASTTTAATVPSSSSTGFNFNFQKSPAMKIGTPTANTSTPRVPNSPEVDEQGLYVTKEGEDSHIHFEPIIQLPDKIEAKTGEEEEAVLFESRARMYRFVSGEWKEKGVGVMKILEHKTSKKGRVLMRRDQVFKICCNHVIKPELDLQPMPKMEGKAWLWYAMDFSDEEGKMEQLAVRFKKPETAREFKDIFDRLKTSGVATTPTKGAGQQAKGAADSDDDVIFVKEEQSPFSRKPFTATTTTPTTNTTSASNLHATAGDNDADDDDLVFIKEEEASPEQKALAAKYRLPANFYLYETRKPCKGCLGCTDGQGLPPHAKVVSKVKASPTKATTAMSYADAAKSPSSQPATPAASSTTTTTPTATAPSKSIFGSNASFTPTSTTTSGTAVAPAPVFGGKSIFGSGGGLDTSSSIFGSPSSATGSPSVFGGANKDTPPKDFSSLLKGGNTPTTATGATTTTSSSPFSSFVFGKAGSSIPDFSSLAAGTNDGGQATFMKKAESGTGPFKFHGAGQKLFGSGGGGGGGDGEDGDVPASTDVHFEPIIPLPDLVKIKTGDEDWTNVFCHRAKLYKFDSAAKQWKERGIGDIKVMSYNKEVMFRILQRREQVLKVSCNHLITKDMSLNTMFNSETAWCWVAHDLTEEEPSMEQFAVKFKNKEISAKFSAAFLECQQKLKEKDEQAGVGGEEGRRRRDYRKDVVEEYISSCQTKVVPLSAQGHAGNQQEVVEDFSRSDVVLLGDKGNVCHSKALDITGLDRMTQSSYVALGERGNAGSQKEVTEDVRRTHVNLLGDKGNVCHSKALDVSGQDRMVESTCVPLGDKSRNENKKQVFDEMSMTEVNPLGDKGNVCHSKALDVSGQDRMVESTCVPLGDKSRNENKKQVFDGMSMTEVNPLGDKGNVCHSKALDVSGQDRMVESTCVPLGDKSRNENKKEVFDEMSMTEVNPLGDKGNVCHSKALDVSGQDRMVESTCVPLGDKSRNENKKQVFDEMSMTEVNPLGDKGNVCHSKALDVSGQDRMVESTCVPLGDKSRNENKKQVFDGMSMTEVNPLGDKDNVCHSKALDVSGQDRMVESTCVPLGDKSRNENKKQVFDGMSMTEVNPLGDKDNVCHSKALDVTGQDRMVESTCVPLGDSSRNESQKEVFEDMTSMTEVNPLGDKGNVCHSKALDVTGQDTMIQSSFVALGERDKNESQKEVIEDMGRTDVVPLGDKGNVCHSKALDITVQDRMVESTCVLLGDKSRNENKKEVFDEMSMTEVNPLGDKGNVYHSKALDVSGQDRMVESTCVPLGYKSTVDSQKEVFEDLSMTKVVNPLGDKGNVCHSKALDIAAHDRMVESTCVLLEDNEGCSEGQKEVIEDMSNSEVVPLGDKGNVYHSKTLDVRAQDRMIVSSYVALGDRDNNEGQKEIIEDMGRTEVVPLGDKGNVCHSQALDVSGQDRMTQLSYVALGERDDNESQKEVMEDMGSNEVNPLGDKGNVWHSKSLDVTGQDRMTESTFATLGDNKSSIESQIEVFEDISNTKINPLGDKGNVCHSKALDVTGQDAMGKSTFVALGDKRRNKSQKKVFEDMTRTKVNPLGDKGNVCHSKALDVTGQDRMTQSSYVALGERGNNEIQKEVMEDMGSNEVNPLGDKGNIHYSKALDVTAQDRIVESTIVPLGDNIDNVQMVQEVFEDISSAKVNPLGDKGNVYHSKALDVSVQDRMTQSSYIALGDGDNKEIQKEVIEDMGRTDVVPLGDKGNVCHSNALDVSGQDRMMQSSFVALGDRDNIESQKEVIEDMGRTDVVCLGDKGNVCHSNALDVSGQDRMMQSSFVALGDRDNIESQKEVIEDMGRTDVVPLGDKGNVCHSNALDVAGQDRMMQCSFVALGDRDNIESQKEVIEDMGRTDVVPLGDKGNFYHSKALGVTGQDRMIESSYIVLGERDNNESQKEVIEDMSCTAINTFGDKGNVYHSKALDVTGQDRMIVSTCVPLGDKNRNDSQKEVFEDMGMTKINPLGDKGNVWQSKALDVTGQDTMTESTFAALGDNKSSIESQIEVFEDISKTKVNPLGDKGNAYHSKVLDIAGQDRMVESTFAALGDKSRNKSQKKVKEDMRRTKVNPLGDKGNVCHSKALDVTGQDRMTQSSYVALGDDDKKEGQKEAFEDMSMTKVNPLGDKGNVCHSKVLDIAGQDRMVESTCVPLGYKSTVDSQKEVFEDLSMTKVNPLGDKGNVCHSKALDITGQDRMVESTFAALGDKSRNKSQKKVTEDMRRTKVNPLGDKGNVCHSKALDITGQDRMTQSPSSAGGVPRLNRSSNQTEVNPRVTNSPHPPLATFVNADVCSSTNVVDAEQPPPTRPPTTATPSICVADFTTPDPASSSSSSFSSMAPCVLKHRDRVYDEGKQVVSLSSCSDQYATVTSTTPDSPSAPAPAYQSQGSEQEQQDEDDDGYEDVDDDDDDDDDDEMIIFEKRATLNSNIDGTWKNLGVGQLCVMYNDDLNGNSIGFLKDDKTRLCSHIICREHDLKLDLKGKSCEWKPIDYSTDEAIRRHFRVTFSSLPAAEEFAKVFMEGKRLAMDSELSEKLPTDIDVPEVFSHGEAQKK